MGSVWASSRHGNIPIKSGEVNAVAFTSPGKKPKPCLLMFRDVCKAIPLRLSLSDTVNVKQHLTAKSNARHPCW